MIRFREVPMFRHQWVRPTMSDGSEVPREIAILECAFCTKKIVFTDAPPAGPCLHAVIFGALVGATRS